MSPLLLGLAVLVAVAGSVTEPRPGARTPAQIATRIAAASPWGRIGWLAAVFVAAPLYATGVATRAALWLTLIGLSWTACVLTTALAMDGRAVRLARMAGGRA
ncbi:hypothetical protein [Streptosporangium roseum]|uniref:hypothetical protein n=1 Tax=Streptosporangium roseum TaxID=2001 RepID=UPI0004CC9EED|nr:hypothetical protein [Streptosporangium roseum]